MLIKLGDKHEAVMWEHRFSHFPITMMAYVFGIPCIRRKNQLARTFNEVELNDRIVPRGIM